jgi:hypothetical protein
MNTTWPWVVLAGLGAFHGLNPAMGWLFAVARGLQRGSRAVVLDSMLPIAAGHALSIAIVVAAIGMLRALVDFATLRIGAAVLLIGFGIYRLLARHRARAGMQVGAAQLLLWSFLMATAHGAGLMLAPALLAMPICAPRAAVTHVLQPDPHMQMMQADALSGNVAIAFAAVGVHTLAMLGVATVIAIAVYEWVGLAFLRRAWFNLDLLWACALIGVGAILLATSYR